MCLTSVLGAKIFSLPARSVGKINGFSWFLRVQWNNIPCERRQGSESKSHVKWRYLPQIPLFSVVSQSATYILYPP
jgi:hypothetical protein